MNISIKRSFILKVSILMICFISINKLSAQDKKHIMFFGDSITAGYEIDPDDAFPAIIQRKIEERGLNYRVTNAGVSGETSAGGVRRVDWILKQEIDVFFLELGGTDGLRGIDPNNTKQNLQQIIDKVSEADPTTEIVLAGMEALPNMGSDYTDRFRSIFYELAEENDLVFMPFVLEDVAGDPDLNLPDGIHPTEEGHKIIARNIWELLSPLL